MQYKDIVPGLAAISCFRVQFLTSEILPKMLAAETGGGGLLCRNNLSRKGYNVCHLRTNSFFFPPDYITCPCSCVFGQVSR